MTSKHDTLADRIARAQREMATWDSRFLASMQLQGSAEIKTELPRKGSTQRGELYKPNHASKNEGGKP